MRRARRSLRDVVIWVALTTGIVSLVMDQVIIGVVLLAFGLWQLTVALRRGGGLFVDQRAADKPGKPTVR